MDYLNDYCIKGRIMEFPIFFPDATRGYVKGVDGVDLQRANVEGVVVNTFHLLENPGGVYLEKVGGIKSLMNWPGWVTSDSGGFQIMSLIHRGKLEGKVTSQGVQFRLGPKTHRKKLFTPEDSIRGQFGIGADVIICLDDFTPVGAGASQIEASVKRTVEWAGRCRKEFDDQVVMRELGEGERPILLAVVQGGRDYRARKYCAESLQEIGFDAYGFGGWPLDDEGSLDLEVATWLAELMPDNLPKFALGIGTPQDIVDCFKLGYNMFDCVLPTRDARHGRAYCFVRDPADLELLQEETVHYCLDLTKGRRLQEQEPISEWCQCLTCQHYSRGYLCHLFKSGDSSAGRLVTLHNLHMYNSLVALLRREVS